MKKERIRCIISGLKRFELTELENQLICLAEQNLNQDGPLIQKVEPIVEWIYSQKTAFIRDSVFCMLNYEQERHFSYKVMSNPLARRTANLQKSPEKNSWNKKIV